MQRLKSKLEHAEVFRGKPFMRSEDFKAPNRNLWPESWKERDGEETDPDKDAEEEERETEEDETPEAPIELKSRVESGLSL